MQSRWAIVALHQWRIHSRFRLASSAKPTRPLGSNISSFPRIIPRRRREYCSTSSASPQGHGQRPLHTVPAAILSEKDEDELELDDDVQRFAEACMSSLLPDEEEEAPLSSLDYELGEASIWDTLVKEETWEEEDYYDEVDEIVEGPEPRTGRQAQKRSGAEMLRKFDPENPPDNLEDLQLWLECESQRESVIKFQKVIQDAQDRKDYASLSNVQRQILEWYQPLKDAIEAEQRSYIVKSKSKKDLHGYGPFLCALQPQKLAVILAHESLMHTLSSDKDGSTLASIALRIGDAIEAEVNVQRLLLQQMEESTRRNKERMEGDLEALDSSATEDDAVDKSDEQSDDILQSWMYGASHLQQFIDDANKMDPGKKTRMRTNYANRRARQLLHNSEEWSKTHKLKLGVALIEILLNTTNFRVNGKEQSAFTYEKRYSGAKKQVGRIFLNDNLYKMVTEDTFESLAASTTRHKPMVLPPRDWVAPDDGGYSWLKVDFMRTHGSDMQKDVLREADLSTVFDGLNVLGSVPWVINKKILDVGQRCWHDNIALGDIPTRTDFDVPPMPVRPNKISGHEDKESEGYRAYLNEYRMYTEAVAKHRRMHQKNMDLRSLRFSAMLKLDQAEKFKDFEEIFFPYNVDFRGRAYPVPPHLSNVGSDLCRGMLKFSEAKPLGKRGLYWLKVHLANLAGNDKLTFEGRAEYTEKNLDNVRAAVMDPFGENRWWMTLDDPFQGLAACHEIINAIDSGDPESYRCSLPVHMDGSCNGLQHYAALGRDRVGGKAVNVCDAETPQDVYIGVMHEVIRRVAEEATITLKFENANPEDLSKNEKEALKQNRAAKLVNGLIDRGVVKRTVMTSVYGVTFIGARKQIQEKIEEKLEEKGHDIDEIEHEIHAACGYLASLTMDVMGELFTGARQTMNWLTSCARLIAQQGQPVSWVSPIGVPVVQPYRRSKPFTVVTLLQSVVLMDASDDLPIHKARQVTAFPPNYVHSLDSSHMLLTALEMDRRGLTFSAVHDSFWTHACDVDEMNEALRDCFVQLYEQPLLESLKKTWELRYPSISFPDLPERGDLDMREVKSAKYFFQ